MTDLVSGDTLAQCPAAALPLPMVIDTAVLAMCAVLRDGEADVAAVEAALTARTDTHASGEVICLPNSGCPWKTHLYELERAHGIAGAVKFVLYEDTAAMWRVQAVTVEGTDFTNRVGLLEAWRGLRDAALAEASGIAGAKFVHATGFIGGNATFDGALQMALKTLEADSAAMAVQ